MTDNTLNTLNTVEKLKKSLGALIEAEQLASAKARKAADNAEKTKSSGIREWVSELSGINEPLSDEDINNIAESLSDKYYGHDDGQKKARKSEYKKLIEQRQHAQHALDAADEIIAAAVSADKPKPNVKSLVLGALTVTRKGGSVDTFKSQKMDAFTAEPKSETEKLLSSLDGLEKRLLKRKDAVVEITDDKGNSSKELAAPLSEALSAIRGFLGGRALQTKDEPAEAPAEAPAAIPEEIAELNAVVAQAEEAPVQAEEAPEDIPVDREPEVTPGYLSEEDRELKDALDGMLGNLMG